MPDSTRGNHRVDPSGNDPETNAVAPKEIPYDHGPPIIGHTIANVRDPFAFAARMREKHGEGPFAYRSFGRRIIALSSADSFERILMNKGQIVSSEEGWAPWLGNLFPRGLMLMDEPQHRGDRRIMGTAFKPGPMKSYLAALNAALPERIKAWGDLGTFKFYPAIKQLSLDLATEMFFGLKPGPETEPVNTALTNMVLASVAPIRVPLPFTVMRRGVKGRAYMCDFLASRIETRRQSDAMDMFSQLCRATDEDGRQFTDQEIIDHMIFLWMAAHDTITSSMTTLMYRLARHTDWQDKLRDEIISLGADKAGPSYDDLPKMQQADWCFKEALRMRPPVPSMPRKVLRDFEAEGTVIPAGSYVGAAPMFIHRDEHYWENPGAFDPTRFSPEKARDRHKFAWIPYGGGVHMCLGLHFAVMQAKTILSHLLPKYDVRLASDTPVEFQVMPLTKPVCGLPVRLEKRRQE